MRFWISVCLTTCVCALPTSSASAATIVVPAGGDLQSAINTAQSGDVITLAPNATYTGNFVLPNKGALADYITIRSAAADALLPPAGVRMTPSFSSKLPKLRSPNGMPAMQVAPAANHWRLLFLEFLGNKDGAGDVIALGAGGSTQTQLSHVPYALILDRVYVHGDPVAGQKRGIALHSRDTSILNSWVTECKAINQDSQAISGFNGPGNYLIENNYLEGAAENFMMGGSDPTIPGLVPTNITFRRNYLRKPLAWRDPIIATPSNVAATPAPGAGSLAADTYYYKVQARGTAGQQITASSAASAQVSATIAGTTGGVTISWTPVSGATEYRVYGRTNNGQNMYWVTTNPYLTDNGSAGTSGTPAAGTKWSVKNIFELKSAQDVIVEGNVFDGMWMADQPGYPIVFTPRNQNGGAPWTVVQRVTFQNNLVRHTAGGVNMLGTDNVSPSQRTNHITVRNNIFDDLTAATWGSGSRPFQLGDGADSITIDHNTVMNTQPTVFWLYGVPSTAVTYTNNMSAHSTYGIFGSGQSSGNPSISTYLPGSVVRANVLAGGSASKYPAGNFFPSVAVWQSNFVNYSAGDYHLNASSAYKHAGTDGEDLGANVDVVIAQTANALTGDNTVPPGTTRVQIVTASLPNAVFGQPYAASLSCTGVTGACGWRLLSGSLPAGLSLDGVAGLIFGTPTAVESDAVTLEAYDTTNAGNTASATLTLTIDPPPFVMTMPGPPGGQVGVPYQFSPSVSGTIGSASWTVASGTLPGGLMLDGFTGAISGVPSTWGTTTAVIQVTDSWGTNRSDAKTLTLTIAPRPLAFNPPTLPNGTYQTPYYASLSASGGTGSVVWSAAGTLPEGATLNANGTLSGTPASVGTFTFDVTAQDANWPAYRATATLVLSIDAPAFTASVPAASSGRVGLPFQVTATSVGAVGVTTWSLASGSLPPGVTLSAATGVIAGVPTAAGSFSFVVRAQDSWNASRVALAGGTVDIAPLSLTVTTASLPAGSVRRAYSATLQAIGGTGLTTWSLVSGSLPTGLTLAANGVISGTPVSVGSSSITVQVTDAGWAGNVATATLTVDVTAREIVLYASEASRISGTWSLVNDAAAAGGSRIWNQDRAAAKLATPLANPVNFFEITFEAEAGVGYHLWMRGKADNNAWANDSVYVQYSGSVTATGAATARIGSTSARTVSIEQGTNAGVQGWGWSDDEWDGLGAPIYFAASGTQTVRVQVREDGLSLDQIVLSSATYTTVAPGAPKNDGTILSR
jgi:putative Ig domain-containing protein